MTRIVILAAGKGTRMGSELPKVLVPLNGRPMIEYLMESVVAAGVDYSPVVVVSPENREIISSSLSRFQLEYAVQGEQLGTGHAVACAQEALERDGQKPDNIIVLYGDHPFLKAESIKRFSELSPAALTIMPTQLPDFDDWRHNFLHWGRIVRGADGRVEKIVEYKDASEEERLITEVNPGFMCFNYRWLFQNIMDLKNDNSQKEYYLTDMVRLAFDEGYEIGTVNIEPHEAMCINSQDELQIASDLTAAGLF